MAVSVTTGVEEVATESSASAVSWSSIIAGALTACAVTLLLAILGSGLGLSMALPSFTNPNHDGASATTFAISAAIWLIVVQWVASALGGYVTGRLRTKWVGVHTDEVFFRDTAHGFLAWALATLLLAGVLGSLVSSTVGAGAQAVGSIASATASTAASAGMAAAGNADPSYFIDTLMRPADPRTPVAGANPNPDPAQITRIMTNAAASGKMPDADRTYLSQLVASRTGVSEADAAKRIDTVLGQFQTVKEEAKQAAETARKATVRLALFGALSMVIGAFIASAAAAFGGNQRDDLEDLV